MRRITRPSASIASTDQISSAHATTSGLLRQNPIYSDSAIQTCLMLRAAFKLALRQAEGLMLSVVELLRCDSRYPITRP